MPYLQYQLNIDPETEVRVYSLQNQGTFNFVLGPSIASGMPPIANNNISDVREWGRDPVVTDPFHLKGKQLLIIAHGGQLAPLSYAEQWNQGEKQYFHFPEKRNKFEKIFSLNWLKKYDLPTPTMTFIGKADHILFGASEVLSRYCKKPLPGSDTYNASRIYVPNHILHEDHFPLNNHFYLKPFEALWMDWKNPREQLGLSTTDLVHVLDEQQPIREINTGNPNSFYSVVDIETDIVFIKKGRIDLYSLIKYLRDLDFTHNRYVISCCRAVLGQFSTPTINFDDKEVYLRQKSDHFFLAQLKARVDGAAQMLISLRQPTMGPTLQSEIELKNIEIQKWEMNYELAEEMYNLYINPRDVYLRLNSRIIQMEFENPTRNFQNSHVFIYHNLRERRDNAEFCVNAGLIPMS